MTGETIGSRARHRDREQGAEHRSALIAHPRAPQNAYRTTPAVYKHPTNPEQLSERPVGRHRAEYILSQGQTPLHMVEDKTPIITIITAVVSSAAQRSPEGRLPPVVPIRPIQQRLPAPLQEPTAPAPEPPPVSPPEPTLPEKPQATAFGPRRVPFAALRAEVPDYETSIPLAVQGAFDYYPGPGSPISVPAHELGPAAPGPATATLVAEPEPEPEPEPVIRPRIPSPRSQPGVGARGQASVVEQTRHPATLRSATETKIHERKRRLPRKLVAATAAVAVLGAALIGNGLSMLRKTSAPQAERKSIVLTLPEIPTPLEPVQDVVAQITEPGIISAQDGNQWNAAAAKTRTVLDHKSNAVTNIVAKVGAYDSLMTSPDPDDAGAGASFTMLTDEAIQAVNRLKNTPVPTASQAEIDAARIIDMLNNLGPMETKTLVEQYGSQIEALKADLTAILTPPHEAALSLASFGTEERSSAVSEHGKHNQKPKGTPVFTHWSHKATSISRRDPMTIGRKAIAGLARDHQRRQQKSFFA